MMPYFLSSNKKMYIVIFFLIALICSFLLIRKYIDKNTDSATSNISSNQILGTTNNKAKVCIDAGHGGYDVGTIGNSNIYEKDINLKIALKLGKILEDNNVTVIYTRTSDKVPWTSNNKEDLRTRVNISNEAKVDAFISIHCNANPDKNIKGSETWCRFPNTDGENLAKDIQNEIAKTNNVLNRGLKYESNGSLAVLKLNKAPSVLVETGFLSNKDDLKFISSENGQNIYANNLAKGIMKYLNIQSK